MPHLNKPVSLWVAFFTALTHLPLSATQRASFSRNGEGCSWQSSAYSWVVREICWEAGNMSSNLFCVRTSLLLPGQVVIGLKDRMALLLLYFTSSKYMYKAILFCHIIKYNPKLCISAQNEVV